MGQVVDSNATYLSGKLTRIGISVSHTLTVGDDLDVIQIAIADGMHRCGVTVVTGGLGPTPDDLTREAAAAFAGSTLKIDPRIITAIERRFALLGRSVPSGSERVASVPSGFEILSNSRGTAPGLWYQGENGHVLILLPGVPFEMKAIFAEHVIPRIMQMDGRSVIAQRTLKIAGVGETLLQKKIEEILHLLDPDLSIAYLPGVFGVRIRLTIKGKNATARLSKTEELVRSRLGPIVYGQDDDSVESVVGELLHSQGMTISVAESCTGGLILNQLTNIPGSSRYLLGGIVAYSNLIKQNQLDVSSDALQTYGAVSESVALQMAEGVRARFKSDIGLSVTGIAGPSGGTKEKPVGLVWIGFSDGDSSCAVKHLFGPDRHRNKQKSAIAALDLVRKSLLKRIDATQSS